MFEFSDKSKQNYLQRCFYLVNLMKDKNHEMWENFHGLYHNTKPEESWELFQMLVDEYRKMQAPQKMEEKKNHKKVVEKKKVKKKAA